MASPCTITLCGLLPHPQRAFSILLRLIFYGSYFYGFYGFYFYFYGSYSTGHILRLIFYWPHKLRLGLRLGNLALSDMVKDYLRIAHLANCPMLRPIVQR